MKFVTIVLFNEPELRTMRDAFCVWRIVTSRPHAPVTLLEGEAEKAFGHALRSITAPGRRLERKDLLAAIKEADTLQAVLEEQSDARYWMQFEPKPAESESTFDMVGHLQQTRQKQLIDLIEAKQLLQGALNQLPIDHEDHS